ncbi:MAG: bifunctional UDP-sugar hydrolase/5'-nucleotidase [Nocardioides sp.]
MPSPARSSRGPRLLAAGVGTSLVAASLTVLFTAPAANAAPVDLTLLTINDFHGRIIKDVADDPATPTTNEDTATLSTVEFATTIENLRAAAPGGEANTVIVSGGDNIGASLFASAFAEDEPSVEVLNALEVRDTATGNHEFDRGFDWLKTNVIDGDNPDYTPADYNILGDNVKLKGTDDPAMDESDQFVVAGLNVCIAGAVTEETPTLVNPDGIADLDFSEPVAEVNRVVEDMETDGTPCDVTIATYHEGAPDGTKTLDENIAASDAFDRIVNDTDPRVDAIVTGHTHQKYAYDAPIPGGGTRPVIQTGSYGANVGHITLTVDGGVVTAHTQENVATVDAQNTTLPRVAEVETIVNDAVAAADVVGNVKIGDVTDDITTAYTGGTYGPDGYTGGSRDDRASESTMGHLVADALRETPIAGQPTPDIGVVNPGGLRAELPYAGDTGTSPENTDGAVTFEEANAVLPFVNNVSYVDVTGATFKDILEEQWQRDAGGVIPSRPYLALGLSKNVKVLVDNADDRDLDGSHVTQVWVDGQELDPAATYKIATFSFLAAGGDNFRSFKDGVATDTGKIDRDLWIDGFFDDGTAKSPDFKRRQIYTDAPAEVGGGDHVTIQLERLDLTSQGTLPNTEVVASLKQPGSAAQELDSFPVTAGAATVDLTMPRSVKAGSTLSLVTDVTGTRVDIDATPGPRAAADMTIVRSPDRVIVDKTRTRIKVRVMSAGDPAAGRVTVKAGGNTYHARLDENGRAVVTLRPFENIGKKTVRVIYEGDSVTRVARDAVTFRVRRK